MSDNVPTITWKVTNLDCYPTYDMETDVVFTVHWDCLGYLVPTTGSASGSAFNSRLYGTTGVTYHSGSNFTPYNQLTQPQVLSWVFDSMGEQQKNQIETGAANAIYTQINPPIVSPPLPWLPVPPSIIVQPVGGTITAGSDYTFLLEATGSLPLSYQWYKDGSQLTGATSNTYTITSASLSDAGGYTAIVNNASSSPVSTNTAQLIVNSPVTGSNNI